MNENSLEDFIGVEEFSGVDRTRRWFPSYKEQKSIDTALTERVDACALEHSSTSNEMFAIFYNETRFNIFLFISSYRKLRKHDNFVVK